jgi:hypothetical protein
MALPASYWYLKGFDPITQYEDYIVSIRNAFAEATA